MPETPYEFYKEVRAAASDNMVRSSRALDNITFVGATGSLAAIVGLVSNYIPSTGWQVTLVVLSAFSFVASLILHSLSYEQSVSYNKQVIRELDEWHSKNYPAGIFVLPKRDERQIGGRSLNDWLAARLVVFGISCLVLFFVGSIIAKYGITKQTDTASTQLHSANQEKRRQCFTRPLRGASTSPSQRNSTVGRY